MNDQTPMPVKRSTSGQSRSTDGLGICALVIQRSLAPSNLWHWVVIFESGHVFKISDESFESAEICIIDAGCKGLVALHAAE